jgi:hypothetical protein
LKDNNGKLDGDLDGDKSKLNGDKKLDKSKSGKNKSRANQAHSEIPDDNLGKKKFGGKGPKNGGKSKELTADGGNGQKSTKQPGDGDDQDGLDGQANAGRSFCVPFKFELPHVFNINLKLKFTYKQIILGDQKKKSLDGQTEADKNGNQAPDSRSKQSGKEVANDELNGDNKEEVGKDAGSGKDAGPGKDADSGKDAGSDKDADSGNDANSGKNKASDSQVQQPGDQTPNDADTEKNNSNEEPNDSEEQIGDNTTDGKDPAKEDSGNNGQNGNNEGDNTVDSSEIGTSKF